MVSGRILRDLCITVGYRCNFKCKHCIVADKKPLRLAPSEIQMLSELGRVWSIKNVLFVGGEPTLYIDDINRILSGFPSVDRPRVTITTNGHFASSISGATRVLSKFTYLDAVQLSYDRYHKEFLPIERCSWLYRACQRLGKTFSVILTIQSPMDLALIGQFKGMEGVSVGIQKVHPTPTLSSKVLKEIYPEFDRSVLRKRCPNLGKMVYLCGEGFSTCCSYLTRGKQVEKFIHPSILKHRKSWFYKLISKHSFGAIARKLGIEEIGMMPERSSPCVLCEHIFSTKIKAEKPLQRIHR